MAELPRPPNTLFHDFLPLYYDGSRQVRPQGNGFSMLTQIVQAVGEALAVVQGRQHSPHCPCSQAAKAR